MESNGPKFERLLSPSLRRLNRAARVRRLAPAIELNRFSCPRLGRDICPGRGWKTLPNGLLNALCRALDRVKSLALPPRCTSREVRAGGHVRRLLSSIREVSLETVVVGVTVHIRTALDLLRARFARLHRCALAIDVVKSARRQRKGLTVWLPVVVRSVTR